MGVFVQFSSHVSELINPPASGYQELYVHDRSNSETEIVSISSDGSQSGFTERGMISADGRFVIFESESDNLVSDDTNECPDIFRHDLLTGQTIRVSVDPDGNQWDSASSSFSASENGRYIVYDHYRNSYEGPMDVYIYDVYTQQTSLVSISSEGTPGEGISYGPTISENGRYVVFTSKASNLVQNDNNGFGDVFLHDRQTGETRLISISNNGEQGNGTSGGPVITPNGRYIVYSSVADNLIDGDINLGNDLFLFDVYTEETSLISVNSDGIQGTGGASHPAVSADGLRIVASSGATNFGAVEDTNGETDIFLFERQIEQDKDQYESDDVFALGTPIQSGQSQTHSISPAWDKDWLTFTLDEPGVVMLETSGASGDTILRLFNSDHYEIVSDDDGGTSQFSRIEAGSCQDTLPAGTYYVKVEEDGDDEEIPSYNISLLVDPCIGSDELDPPSLIYPVSNAVLYECQPEFTWSSVTGADTYEIEILPFGANGTQVNAEPDINSYTPSLVLRPDTYYWQARARNKTGSGDWSTGNWFTIKIGAPNNVSPVTNDGTYSLTPTFDWSDVCGADGYDLFAVRYDETGTPQTAIYTGTTVSEYTPSSDLTPGIYAWYVRAKSGTEYGPWNTFYWLTLFIGAPNLQTPVTNDLVTAYPGIQLDGVGRGSRI